MTRIGFQALDPMWIAWESNILDAPANTNTEVPQVQDGIDTKEWGVDELDSLEGFSRADIRRNRGLLLTFNVLFAGSAVLMISPVNPLLVALKATNGQIGMVNGAIWAAMIAHFFCPYISRLFKIKRWFLFGQGPLMNVPQILIGLFVMFPLAFHVAKSDILPYFIVGYTINWFTSGFFFMPLQELVMTSLPRSFIGRLNGLSNSLGTVLAMITTVALVGYLRFHSDSYHLALVLVSGTVVFWIQMALFPFLKEKPSHTVGTPVPWSKSMFAAAWANKPFIRLLGINALMACTVGSNFSGSAVGGIAGFVCIYAMKDLHMTAAQSVSLVFVSQVVAVLAAGPTGFIMDKFGVKKLVPLIAVCGLFSNLCLIFIRNQWGVYIGVAFAGLSSIIALTTVTSLFCILPKSEHRNGHFAIQWMVSYATQAIGFILMGRLLDKIPFVTVFMIASGIYVLIYPMLKWAIAPIPAPDPEKLKACV